MSGETITNLLNAADTNNELNRTTCKEKKTKTLTGEEEEEEEERKKNIHNPRAICSNVWNNPVTAKIICEEKKT